ncbi:MAG: hypothetical protein PHT37_00530 [Candidatus Cloacimonetes bacterium]|jgi:hypothetical protein|nr:hypothetical protein [Candidatus Cloacimonadota bacterium]MDD2423071.1 hypothetical protein [Candidatus Cloacimonadota bacterium]MDD3563374.1 hypothetical protein [Candidatus Cloacimonadota bacterium]MDD4276362.1 hypothetical protein [Candidatus Cloacimonadota bacterium]MDY0324952.1 hypothetical protein [Candidatus Cloacimonadaceae bacterium]
MTAIQFFAFSIPLFIAPIVWGIYASIAIRRKVKIHNLETWKKASIESNITQSEFIVRVQQLCAGKGYFLLDIIQSDDSVKAVIKEAPTVLWGFGQFYCIEYKAIEKPKVTVYVRSGVFKGAINKSAFRNAVNAFAKLD